MKNDCLSVLCLVQLLSLSPSYFCSLPVVECLAYKAFPDNLRLQLLSMYIAIPNLYFLLRPTSSHFHLTLTDIVHC